MKLKLHKILIGASLVIGAASLAQARYRAQDVSDDCSFVRSAIAALPPAGGEVTIPAGLYNCAAPIIIDRDNVALRGVSRDQVILRLKDHVHAPLLIIGDATTRQTQDGKFVTGKPVKNISVSNLTVDGNRANHDPSKECGEKSCDGDTDSVRNNGITIRGASYILVENVAAHSTISGGMVTEKYCDHLTVRNFESYNNYFDGLAGYETNQSLFEGLYLHNNRGAGISIDINFSFNILKDSRLHDNGDVGIFARFLKGNTFQRLDIQRSGNHGVFMANDGQPGTCTENNVFDSVTINGSKGSGIRLNDDCRGNRVIGYSNLCGNRDGAYSEPVAGALLVGQSVACRNERRLIEAHRQ